MTLIFEAPDFSHKEAVDAAVKREDVRLCDQTFGNIYAWAAALQVTLAVEGESFAVCWGKRHAVPVGPARKEMVEALLAQGVERFICVSEQDRAWMEREFPARFTFTENRNSADYLYDREKMEQLTGKKLAAKRNHINYFEQNHSWETRPIDESNLQEIFSFNEKWCADNDCTQDPSLMVEGCAVRRGLRHFKELGYRGLALYADGVLCAFTYGEPIGSEGFCVHVEKADAALRGAYPMINRQFVRSLPPEIRWINREDDAGDEGLRRAKLGYQPTEILMKYTAEVVK